jgi:alpha-L-fucosidase
MLKGIKNKINRIYVVGNGTKLNWDIKMKQYWSQVPGIVYIDVPEAVLDEEMTIIAVLLDGKIDLYREKGQVLESN